ncbi:MAG: selenocysteine-specific translation elongation factor, partial [Candidatus Omnitrophica bacterium]|nr:selenocysteine-specific translation elongation factor [Candidatus Omnitrophota bacterium]
MNFFVIGTAGHVDHGKTALIKALTGIDCDRLKEEKERGMTIDIGFAYFDLPNGDCAEIIDVPGHERFIKNMLCGSGVLDLVLLVIAANEGVMPQTREHLDILNLLGIKKGIIVINKADLVDRDWLALVTEQARESVKDTFLADAAIVSLSSVTGEGIEELKKHISLICSQTLPKDKKSPSRVFIDRVFTKGGFGTTVTGTLVSGTLVPGQEVELLPQGIKAKIRSLESHGKVRESAVAGQRVGISLAGIKREELFRGTVICRPGCGIFSSLVDARMQVLPSAAKPLKNNTRVRFYVGTGEYLGRIVLLDNQELAGGKQGLVQLRLEKPLACAKADRFILRLYSPVVTVAGGQVINPAAVRHKRFDSQALAELVDAEKMAEDEFKASRHAAAEHTFHEKCLAWLEDLHKKNPFRLNVDKQELKSHLSSQGLDVSLFEKTIEALVKDGLLILEKDKVRLKGHSVRLGPEQARVKEKIEAGLLKSPFAPQSLRLVNDGK